MMVLRAQPWGAGSLTQQCKNLNPGALIDQPRGARSLTCEHKELNLELPGAQPRIAGS